MKKYKLFINKFAEKDLENSSKYYNEQQEGLGNAFLLEIKAVIFRIENNPYQFPKIEKEANRYIKRWEDEKIAIENGRWGPFIRFKRKSVKLPKVDGKKPDPEELKNYTLEQVQEIIEAEIPGSIKKKTAKKTKKAPTKNKK